MYNSLTYGTVIKELRHNRFLSQGELAEDICSQGMLSRIENNDVVPNVLVMQKICEKLDVSVHYVLTREETRPNQRNQWLELLREAQRNKQNETLAETIAQIEKEEIDVFKTKLELQEYAYYRGLSAAHQDETLDLALKTLQEGLNYTYNRRKDQATDMEVILLSEIGKLYYAQGKSAVGLSFMKRSLTQFYAHINKRINVELTKLFYNIAVSLIDMKEYDDAMEYIEQGILWSQKQKNYYFLANLYMLKGVILKDTNRLEEAIVLVEIADTLEKLAK